MPAAVAAAHLAAMPLSPTYRPDPRFAQLGAEFADPVQAGRLSRRPSCATATIAPRRAVGLDDADRRRVARPFRPLRAAARQPRRRRWRCATTATSSASYNPDLGDGRGFLFAQLREAGTGRLLDLGTKGSGQTPWSRFGDGRLTLKGGVREVLATAMLEALGVPTSRSFSLIETGEALAAQRRAQPDPLGGADPALAQPHPLRHASSATPIYERADLIGELVDYVGRDLLPRASATRRTSALARCCQAVPARSAELVGALDGGGLRARRAQHRQHEHHRRELRLRPLSLPAAQRPQLHRRLFRRDRALQPSAASPRRCSGTCSSWPAR